MLTDAQVHAPPDAGLYGYSSYGPSRATFMRRGEVFVDPVFNSTIRRLTDEYPRASQSDIYAKNGFWNADGTRMAHNTPDGLTIIDTTTGGVVRINVPGNFDGSFAPDDPDIWYYFDGPRLLAGSMRHSTAVVVKEFHADLGRLGGSLDWIDASGRYMVLNVGGQGRVYDRLADILYAGAIPGDTGEGWLAMSPDARYVVAVVEEYIPGVGQPITSFAIDHSARTVSTTGVMFWSLGGDHGDLVSTPDGRTLFITKEAHTASAIYAVDVSIPQTAADLAKQRADNRRLLPLAWADLDGHISCGGPWAYVSVESTDEREWRPYTQEILRVHVVTGEVQRLAHHRSRGNMENENYRRQPRVCASWDGSRVAWASNFGADAEGYADIYTIALGGTVEPVEPPVEPTPPPPFPPPVPPTSDVTHTIEIRVDGKRKLRFTI